MALAKRQPDFSRARFVTARRWAGMVSCWIQPICQIATPRMCCTSSSSQRYSSSSRIRSRSKSSGPSSPTRCCLTTRIRDPKMAEINFLWFRLRRNFLRRPNWHCKSRRRGSRALKMWYREPTIRLTMLLKPSHRGLIERTWSSSKSISKSSYMMEFNRLKQASLSFQSNIRPQYRGRTHWPKPTRARNQAILASKREFLEARAISAEDKGWREALHTLNLDIRRLKGITLKMPFTQTYIHRNWRLRGHWRILSQCWVLTDSIPNHR